MSDQSNNNPAHLSRLLRVCAGVLLVPICCIAWELLRSDGSGSRLSAARLVTVAASLLVALGLAGVLAGPDRWRSWICRHLLARLDWLGPRKPTAGHRLCWLAIIIAWSSFLVAVQRGAPLQDLETTDSAAFSRYASQAADDGGPLALVGMLYRGEYAEANQHPLLIGILSAVDKEAVSFQLVTTGISLAGFILVTLLVIRLAGYQVGAVFAALLATNAGFGHLSLQVTCECLLIPLVTLSWWHFQHWTEADSKPSTWPVMIAGGVLLGLAYLAKGTGPIFLVGTLAWLLLANCCSSRSRPDLTSDGSDVRQEHRRWQMALVLLAAWMVTASPLLVRNMQMYGSPLYNVNSHFLFLDEFENPSQVASRITIGEAAQEYIASHTAGEMIRREASGLAWESFNLARLLGPHPLTDSRALPGILLLMLALLGMGLHPGTGWRLIVCWLLLLFPLFAWYDPIVRSGERFLSPLIPALLFYAAVALGRLLSPNPAHTNSSPTRRNLLPLACIAWCLVWNGALWIHHTSQLASP